jgi:cardiolipin synthase
MEIAFAQMWAAAGGRLPGSDAPLREAIPPAGNVMLRVVASMPNTLGLYRLDQLIAALARRSLWLTDAYYVGMTPYVQALRAAATDGVDVRLLVPGGTDIPILRALSRAGYQPLLEAGVRVFEWNGPMLHAKTAVADGRWARVGSTNLNPASWIGNYELDVAVEDEGFARTMEDMYLEDLANSTEIVLSEHHRVLPVKKRPRLSLRQRRESGGSAGRVGTRAIRIGNMVSAAITNRRVLGPAEASVMLMAGLILLGLALLAVLWPRWVALPAAFFCGWLGISLSVKAYRLHRKRRKEMNAFPQKEDLPAKAGRSKDGDGNG